jgi:hypothetical protein
MAGHTRNQLGGRMKHMGTFACEKVIFDNRGAPSLLTILQNAHINALPGAQPQAIPENAVMPKEWFVFSAWVPSSEEMGKRYEEVCQVYLPNQEKFTETRTEFISKERWQYNAIQFMGLPVGREGDIRIIIWLDLDGHRVTELIEYNFRINHGPAPPPPPPPELKVYPPVTGN